MAGRDRLSRAIFGVALALALATGARAAGAQGLPAARHDSAVAGAEGGPRPSTTLPVPKAPPPNRAVIGIALSGYGAHLRPPLSPTYQRYSSDCHALLDPAFTGKCVVASGPFGSVAGVVEEEQAAFNAQERDLVWHREGQRWSLALVRVVQICRNGVVCGADPGLPTLLWRDDILRDGDPRLVFVTPTDQPGFGNELDVVDGTGRVSLFRYLGDGFAVVPPAGGLVTYVPGGTEAAPASPYFDQVLIGFSGGSWRVFSQQYVPYAAALAQHKAAFWDPRAVPAG